MSAREPTTMNTGSFFRTIFLPSTVLVSTTGILPAQNLSSSSDYVNALTSINSAVTGGTGNSYALEFNSGLTVTPGTGAFINAGTGNTVSINGNGGSLSGGNTLTPAVIFSGTVSLGNLTIENGFGQGGGGDSFRGEYLPGGGGAGLGGGLFIATSSVVSLDNVSVRNNSTSGGRAYGGPTRSGGSASFVLGLTQVDSNGVPTAGPGNPINGTSRASGGQGTSGGGQQSLSYIAGAGYVDGRTFETNGTTGSTYDGGGGGASISYPLAYGGSGKMGGGDGTGDYPLGGPAISSEIGAGGGGGLVGGGGAMNYGVSSSGGGFGGGGGSRNFGDGSYGAGGGGFGAGGGGSVYGAGGGGFGGMGGVTRTTTADSGWGAQPYNGNGASLGGGIFVMFGAELTIAGSSTFSGNSGSGSEFGVPYYDDTDTMELGALGSDLFVMTGGKATLAPGAGNTIRFQGTIDDDSSAQRFVLDENNNYVRFSNGAGARIKIGSASNPGGTVIFEGRTGYAGGTEMVSGTLSVDGNTGSIKSGSDLIFTGTSGFQYDNANSSANADKTQTFGTLAFQDGEGTVTNVKGNALSSTLGFGTVTRSVGATGNFVVADGTNGGDNKILIGGAAGFRSPGLFFGGSNYATVDGSGYVRGFDYGVDANGIVSAGGSSISGTPDSSSNVKLGDAITAQTTATLNTLNLNSCDVTLGDGQTLTLNGILQSGGTNTISGGNGLACGTSDGDLVIRTDTEVDFLTISTAITAPNLIKGGTGVLLLSGSNHITGSTAIHSGVLIAESASVFPAGADLRLSPAALLVLNFTGSDAIDELYIGGVKQKAGTWGAEGSGATFTSSAIVGTGILAVTGGEVTFQGWAGLNGLDGTSGKESGANDDPDQDGVPNLLEFVLGGEPLAASTGVLPTSSVSGGSLELHFNRNDLSETHVGLSVQTSSDFITWTSYPVGASSSTDSGVIVMVEENGDSPDLITISVPVGANTKLFSRLVATVD